MFYKLLDRHMFDIIFDFMSLQLRKILLFLFRLFI